MKVDLGLSLASAAAILGPIGVGVEVSDLGARYEQMLAKVACSTGRSLDEVKDAVEHVLSLSAATTRRFNIDEIERLLLGETETFDLAEFEAAVERFSVEAVAPTTPEPPRSPPIGAKLSRRLGKRR